MLELYSNIRPDEWEAIVEETVKYKTFVECLKEVACPILKESWGEEEDWFRVQLGVAVSRMQNIDPLLVSKYNQPQLREEYSVAMRKNAEVVREMIVELREHSDRMLREKYGEDGKSTVSDL